MKQIQQIATLALASLLALNLSGCSEKDEPAAEDTERGIAIESITTVMEGLESNNGEAATRATQTGFSVNTSADPTYAKPEARSGWKMDFTMYNSSDPSTTYTDGSFTEATYTTKWEWTGDKYFPNYKKPQVEALIYPAAWNTSSSVIAKDQSTSDNLLAQDVLIKTKGTITTIAHNISIQVEHKHIMLDFVIKGVVISDISEVKVWVGSDEYDPCEVAKGSGTTGDIEYMLILSEETTENPIVQITTKNENGNNSIIYKQTINIQKIGIKSNRCYCFTLQGANLKISPVTILNWATGESLPGEYIAVTAYPTFKADGHAGETYYFYYSNELTVDGKAKLQEITFNENAECTIKPDGRVLTHIYAPGEVEPIGGSGYSTPKSNATASFTGNIILNQMVITLSF